MKKIIILLNIFCVLFLNNFSVYGTPTTPTTISYQGVLTDGSDVLIADGEHSVTFKLYEVLNNGSELWSETQNVSTTNGLFNVDLGSVNGVTGVDFSKQLYLEVIVESIVLSPRIKFTAQPYAFVANTLNETLPLAKGGTGATTAEDARVNLGLGALSVEDNIGDDMWSGTPLSIEHGGTGVNSIEDLQTSLSLGELAYLDVISNDFWSGEDLAVTNGGTGASNVEDARANLGLGTLSTQAANNVTITGGTLNGATIGASSASSSKFTSTETGSLKVTGGIPGAGKVLTSDADGNARWEEVASGGGSGTSGGAEIIETYNFDGDFAWDNFDTIQVIEVPSTGQYLVTCTAALKEVATEFYTFHLKLMQGATKLAANSNTSGQYVNEVGELEVTFAEVLDLSSTTNLVLLAKMNNTYTKPYEGKITLTKLTASGGNNSNNSGVVELITSSTFNNNYDETNIVKFDSLQVPSTGLYSISVYTDITLSTGSLDPYEIQIKQGSNVLAGESMMGNGLKTSLKNTLNTTVELTSTEDIYIEGESFTGAANAITGRVTFTKLTAPGSSNSGSSSVPTVIRQTFADQDFTIDGEDSFALAIVKTVTGAQIGDAVLINLEGLPDLENPYINANFLNYSGYVSNTNEVTIRLHSSGFGGDLDYEDIDIIVTVIRPIED